LNVISDFGKSLSFPITRFKNLAFSLLVLILTGGTVKAQVLNDTATLKQVKETVDLVYNMQFRDATEKCDEISRKYPEHPVIHLLRGIIIYWQNYPLLSDSDSGSNFEEQIHLCINKCDDFEPENEVEFLLTNMCARASLLAYYAGNELQSKVFSLGRTTYRYLRRSFGYTGTFPDFWFFTGLYNYYREAYPEAHPAYKPVFVIFPSGDMERGLKELRIAYKESIFLKAEASTFLSSIYKYFENDYVSASHFSATIYNEYPMNTVYRINHIEDLLLNEKYDEAEKLIESPDSKKANGYFQAQISILRGILDEKKYNDMIKAEQEYKAGIENISEYGAYGNQHAAYAWFGLSRISRFNNDRHGERICRRKAHDLTDFENVSFDD